MYINISDNYSVEVNHNQTFAVLKNDGVFSDTTIYEGNFLKMVSEIEKDNLLIVSKDYKNESSIFTHLRKDSHDDMIKVCDYCFKESRMQQSIFFTKNVILIRGVNNKEIFLYNFKNYAKMMLEDPLKNIQIDETLLENGSNQKFIKCSFELQVEDLKDTLTLLLDVDTFQPRFVYSELQDRELVEILSSATPQTILNSIKEQVLQELYKVLNNIDNLKSTKKLEKKLTCFLKTTKEGENINDY